jgi:Ca-activated chloride channel family protein
MTISSGTPKPMGGAPWMYCEGSVDCITLAVRVTAAAAVLAGTLVLATGPAGAQFTSGVNLVEVYASVTDAEGNAVTDLKASDFELRENGEPQTVTNFTAGEFPLSVAIGLDRSFSMSGTRLSLAKSAAQAFLEELRPQDEAMILAIGSQVEVAAPLSANRAAQQVAINKLDAFGTTGLHDAIITAIDEVQPAKGRRALVLLSDGNDRYSQATAVDALERARRSDVMIYPVGIGQTRAPLFAELATVTGGRSFYARDAVQLSETLRSIARELRRQYLLGYTPTRPPVSGSNEWRSISVTVKRPDVHVRARDGYLVK